VNTVDVSGDVIFGLPPDPSVYPVPALSQGVNDFSFFGTDVAGNVESPEVTASVKLDSVVPTCAIAMALNVADITAGDATPGSGVDHIDYVFLPAGATPNGGTVWVSASGSSVTSTTPPGLSGVFARSVLNVTAGVTVSAVVSDTWTLHYTAGTGGSIAGSSTQVVVNASDGTTVTATPGVGYHFVSWSDGVLTAARRDTNVTTDKSVSAAFAIDTFTLHYTAGAHGSIVGSATQVVDYGGNGSVVTATPATGYHFVSWSDGGLTAARHGLNVTADKSVSASFAINTYTLQYNAGAHGSIVGSATQAVDFGSNGTTVTAAPGVGYHFVSWSDGVLTAARADLSVAANLTVTASFALDTFAIVPSAGAHGSISPSTTQTVDYGSDATFTITPSGGYHVANVLVDGVSVGAVTSYTFQDVIDDHTISATFASNLVKTTISIVANHTSVHRGHLVYFHGVVKPDRLKGTHVKFYVRKSGSTTWKLVSTRHTFLRHHWNYYYHPATHGTYYFQVRLSATSKYAARTSRTIKVIWR
jgi:hypothetical protein